MSATGPQEAGAYSATEVEAIERDLKCYSDSYWYLQLQEVESCYGPVEPKAKELQALCAKGTCNFNVSLAIGRDCVEATLPDSEEFGSCFKEGVIVVISREHPAINKFKSFTGAERRRGQLQLTPYWSEPEIEEGLWRLDVEANRVPLFRLGAALDEFTSIRRDASPSALQVLIGTEFGNAKRRRAINQASVQQPANKIPSLACLNRAQGEAVQGSFSRRVQLIQGPPGTDKTQVADVIFRIWKSVGVQGPAVGAAPSKVGHRP